MSEEKRRFTRVPFKVHVQLTVDDVSYSAEEISNLSVGGCLLPISGDLEAGAQCHVRIVLSGTTRELTIGTDGKIVRCTPDAVAVEFVRIDPDSLFHLQNVVRYNSPDPDAVEAELRKHLSRA
ncbi:MAG: PilZ domain-containing protein [Deltaproteobacteria bacterium]|nr:PilZ domain-containing protein [Deltaproteobacteria bacterium]